MLQQKAISRTPDQSSMRTLMRSKLISLHILTWPNLSKTGPAQQAKESLPSGTITLGFNNDLSQCHSIHTKCVREGCDVCRDHAQYMQLD
jgi:hypothetical protein